MLLAFLSRCLIVSHILNFPCDFCGIKSIIYQEQGVDNTVVTKDVIVEMEDSITKVRDPGEECFK